MSSGRIAIIDKDGNIMTSTRFIGKIAPLDVEKKFTNFFEDIKSPDGFISVAMDLSFVYDKNKNEDLVRRVPGDWYNTRYNYENNWNCDYVYIKNLSPNTKHFATPDGLVPLAHNETLTLNLGKPFSEKVNKLTPLNVGDVVTVADIEWIILKKNDDSVFCLTKDIIDTTRFDVSSADYSRSEIRRYLQDLSIKIKNKIGENAFIQRCIDLKVYSDMPPYNIRFNYGMVLDDIGLLTENEYKENQSIINKYQVNNSWWLATTHSSWRDGVRCIDADGEFHSTVYDYKDGVRPACIFSVEAFN